MEQVIYSIYSKKIMHHNTCSIVKRIKKSNRRMLDISTAREKGYKFCECCNRLGVMYNKEKDQIDRICKSNGIKFAIDYDMIYIISKHDFWRIKVNENSNNKVIFLFHKNTHKRTYKKGPEMIEGYHVQKFRSKTICGYLEYIIEHDQYRDLHPCTETERDRIADNNKPKKGTRRYKNMAKKKKNLEKVASVIRVRALIDEMAGMPS